MRIRSRFALHAFCVVLSWSFASAADVAKPNPPPAGLDKDASAKREILAAVRLGLRQDFPADAPRIKKLVGVTERPFYVEPTATSVACASVTQSNPMLDSPREEHWIHVYVTPSGQRTLVTGKGEYPEGTLILKQKFFDEKGTKTDLYTGMRKREKGYNPAAGDWEFFVLNADATSVESVGRLRSCIGCHAPFRSTDFVSRRYVTAKDVARK